MILPATFDDYETSCRNCFSCLKKSVEENKLNNYGCIMRNFVSHAGHIVLGQRNFEVLQS